MNAINNTVPALPIINGNHSSFLEKAVRLQNKAKDVFNRIVPKGLQDVVSEAINFVEIVEPVIENTYLMVSELLPKPKSIQSTGLLQKIFSKINGVFKAINEYKIIPIISAPFIVYDLAVKIHKFAKGIIKNNPLYVLTDKTLAMIKSVVVLTGLIATFVGNSVFGTVAGFLSAINIVIYGKSLYHTVKLYKQLIQKLDNQINPLKNISKRDLKNILEADNPREMIEKVNAIWDHPDTAPAAKEEITKAFRKRAIQKIVSNALKVVACVINVVAMAIFLAFPPLSPVVFGLYALSALIHLGEDAMNKIVGDEWERTILKHQVV